MHRCRYGDRARGFTLIELMLVVAIIGILAAIAIPAFSEYTKKAERSEAFTLARPVMVQVAAYYDRWGRLPASNAEAGLPPPNAYIGRNVRSIEVKEGAVHVTWELKSKSAKETIRFLPQASKEFPTAPLRWETDEKKKS